MLTSPNLLIPFDPAALFSVHLGCVVNIFLKTYLVSLVFYLQICKKNLIGYTDMAKIISFAQTIRRNWKKSTLFFGVLSYGVSYGVEKYRTFEMMRAYCKEAQKHGEMPLPQTGKPKHVTVILNPEANDKKCNVQFEKFAAPLLHLAGFKVSVFRTEKEKQAQELMHVMSNTDAVLVAGGNGTVHEVVTGLLSRTDMEGVDFPLGIIPLGKTNTVAKYLFSSKSSSNAQLMAESVMAIIRERTVALDVLKVQYGEEENTVYAMSSFEEGAFANTEEKVSKYWYLGSLKARFAYFLHSLKDWNSISNDGLEYIAPCDGCSKCYIAPRKKENSLSSGRWWQAFVPRTKENSISDSHKDYSQVTNENCGNHVSLPTSYSNISVSTVAAGQKPKDSEGSMWIKMFPSELSVMQFFSLGMNHRKCKLEDETGEAEIMQGREVILQTQKTEEENDIEEFHYIDNEKYKRVSCIITLLPQQLKVYG